MRRRDGDWWERRSKNVFGNSPFFMTRSSSAAQAGLIERLHKLNKEWRLSVAKIKLWVRLLSLSCSADDK